MPKVLTLDYETRSPVDLKSCGAHVYTAITRAKEQLTIVTG